MGAVKVVSPSAYDGSSSSDTDSYKTISSFGQATIYNFDSPTKTELDQNDLLAEKNLQLNNVNCHSGDSLPTRKHRASFVDMTEDENTTLEVEDITDEEHSFDLKHADSIYNICATNLLAKQGLHLKDVHSSLDAEQEIDQPHFHLLLPHNEPPCSEDDLEEYSCVNQFTASHIVDNAPT